MIAPGGVLSLQEDYAKEVYCGLPMRLFRAIYQYMFRTIIKYKSIYISLLPKHLGIVHNPFPEESIYRVSVYKLGVLNKKQNT